MGRTGSKIGCMMEAWYIPDGESLAQKQDGWLAGLPILCKFLLAGFLNIATYSLANINEDGSWSVMLANRKLG